MMSAGRESFLARSAGAIPRADVQTLSWPETVLQIPVELLVVKM